MKLLIIILLLMATYCLTAQTAVTGFVKDAQNVALPNVSVSLMKSTDTIPLLLMQTDRQGRYKFTNVAPGNYFVKATATGTQPVSTAIFRVAGSGVAVPEIVLQPVTQTLQNVTITAVPQSLEMKDGRLVYNVEKSINAAGSTAFDLLKKMPGIRADEQDNLLLKGSGAINVMIDGKMTYLSAQQLSNYLKNTAAESLARIEIITTPSSQFDAAGNLGIINMVTKKQNREGYAATISAGAGAGHDGQTNESIAGNVRTKKWNVFGSYNYNYNHTYLNRSSYRTIGSGSTAISFDRRSYDPAVTNNNGYKAGIDVYLNKKTEIGFVYNGSRNHWSRLGNGPTYLGDASGKIDSLVQNRNTTDEPSVNNTCNFNITYRLDTLGKMMTADADAASYNSHSDGMLGNQLFSNNGAALSPYEELRFRQPTRISIRSVKADATLPYKRAELKAGLKYSQVTSDNDFVYDSLIAGNYIYSSVLSNHFVYDEKIAAAYFSVRKAFSKTISAEAGGRIENTASKGNSLTAKIVTGRSYTNFFPYVSFTKTMDANNSLSLSVTRRINRPVYSNLNPFHYFFDKYSYTEGNPYLQPELSWNAGLAYTFRQNYVLTLNYSRTSQPILSFAVQDSATGIMRISNYNFSHKDIADVLLILPVKITRWWSVQNTLGMNYQTYLYQQDKTLFQPHLFSFDGESIHTVKLPWKMSFEGIIHYTSPSLGGVYLLRYYFAFDGGFKKSFLNNHFDARLSFTDLFYTDHYWGYSVYSGTNVHYDHRPDSRRIKINFSYRFGGKLITGKTHRLEEQDRL